MLGSIRRRKNNPIVLVLLVVACLAMVLLGITFQSGPKTGKAATVNGEDISEAAYTVQYTTAFRSRQARDRTFDRTKAKQEKLKETILDQMITTKLLSQNARSRGLEVDGDALKDAIIKNEIFQTDGKFDPQTYQRVLNNLQTTAERFEAQERERLLAKSVLSSVLGMGVSDQELKETFYRERRKIVLNFIEVKHKGFESQVTAITPDEAKTWAAKEGSKEKIAAHYKRFKSTEYDVPKQVCARHILVRVNKATPEKERAQKRSRLVAAQAALKAGMAFEDAAKKFSEDANKEKGGDLGCFSAGQTIAQLEEAAFKLKPGETSGIVESPFGLHIVRVHETKEPVRKKLEDVETEIAQKLAIVDKAKVLSKAQADAIFASAQKHPTLEAALKEVKKDAKDLKVKTTDPFPQGRNFIPPLGVSKEIARAAWLLTTDKPLPETVLSTQDAWVVVRLKERQEPSKEEFESQKGPLTYRLIAQKQNGVFDAWSKSLRKEAQVTTVPALLKYD